MSKEKKRKTLAIILASLRDADTVITQAYTDAGEVCEDLYSLSCFVDDALEEAMDLYSAAGDGRKQ